MLRPLLLLALVAAAVADEKKPEPPKIDVGAVLRKSEKFKEQCKTMRVAYEEGVVRAVGEIGYRGGGPCEYLVSVFPAKSHETIVLLDDGPWKGEGRRPNARRKDYATVLNNAFLAAGFKRGKPFSWDEKTGDVFPPKGEAVHLYAEWTDPETNKAKRALLADWLWNFKTVDVMQESFVYTGSLLIEHEGKKFLGAEMDGLIAAVLNTGSALIDSLEDGSLDNGAYEAIPIRIPPTGTRVKMVFSKKELPAEKFKALKLNDELKQARAKYLAEKKKKTEKKEEK
ncbi:MAG: YdjY domain-containing protein [Planctomycetota bacterium]|jgi:hypothetical protein